MKYVLLLLLLAQPMAAQTLTVIHEKRFWRDSGGTIQLTDEGIVYRAKKEKESRKWKYEDIQYFDRISSKEFTILSYEDSRILLGRDKQYHFLIVKGELTDDVFHKITGRLNKPATNRQIPRTVNAQYEIPVKHLHTFGGCQGTLEFTENAIYYVTDYRKDAREWILARDIQSVWSSDRYQLEIYAFDNNRREFSRLRVYKFDLKQPLDQAFYRSLKIKLFDLETAHHPIP
jgi:hypothetical protein